MTSSSPITYSNSFRALSSTPLQSADNRSSIKVIPCANGGNVVGPLQQFEFYIPPSPNGFIKPNSMYLKVRIEPDIVGDVLYPTYWAFGGQCGLNVPNQTDIQNVSPASSVIERIDVIFGNGATMTYNRYDIYQWAINLTYCVTREYTRYDLKQLMMCHNVRIPTADPNSRVTYACIPLDIPVLNSASAMPLCLLNQPITIRFSSNSVAEAFFTMINPFQTYTLSEMSVVYEQIDASPAFMQEFRQRHSQVPYTIAVNDRGLLGTSNTAFNSSQVNINANLSSLKAVLSNHVPISLNSGNLKTSRAHGITRFNLFVDQVQMNPMPMDTDVICFAELNRALQNIFDTQLASNIQDIPGNGEDQRRTTYVFGQFVMGILTARINEETFALKGIPANQISFQTERGIQDIAKWTKLGGLYYNGPIIQYYWGLFDSVVDISADGNVSIRK